MYLKDLNIDLGSYFEALRKIIWRTFFPIRGHNTKYHDMLRVLGPPNRWGVSTLGYDGSAVTAVVGLVHGKELLVREDHHSALTLLFELA